MNLFNDSKFNRVVKRHLNKSYVVWLTTVGADLTPQPRPVWFIWENKTILVFSQRHAHKVQHIARHPNVSLHFPSDEKAEKEVVVIVGEAIIDASTPPAHNVRAYFRKYKNGIADLNMTPEEFSEEYSVAIRVTPTKIRGWS